MAGLVLVAARALGLAYVVFWACSLVLLLTELLMSRRTDNAENGEHSGLLTRWHLMGLMLMAIVAASLTYTAHRPDSDDAVYIGSAADAVAHPEAPVLARDFLYGGHKLPLMLPSYALESYPLLAGLCARLFGREPIFWAHAVLATLAAFIMAFAWAEFIRPLTERRWLVGTAMVLIILALPAESRALGNFAYVRLFEGKAILATIAIPLLYAFTWKFQITGSLWDWGLALAATIACLGLSSSAVFIAPLALGSAILAGWRSPGMRRAAAALVPAAYPVICGLMVRGDFAIFRNVFAYWHPTAAMAIGLVFGERSEYLFLLCLLLAPVLRAGSAGHKLLVLVTAYFAVALNPFVFKMISKLTTPEAVWRVLWSVPVAGIAATVVLWFLERAKHGGWSRRVILVVLLVASFAYLAQRSTLSRANEVSFSLRPLKVREEDWQMARAAIAATDESKALLAPEQVAVWVPTFVHRPLLVSVRQVYDEEMGVHLAEADGSTRRELRELVSGKVFPPARASQLLDRLVSYQVSSIVVTAVAAEHIAPELRARGYVPSIAQEHYQLFLCRQDACGKS